MTRYEVYEYAEANEEVFLGTMSYEEAQTLVDARMADANNTSCFVIGEVGEAKNEDAYIDDSKYALEYAYGNGAISEEEYAKHMGCEIENERY